GEPKASRAPARASVVGPPQRSWRAPWLPGPRAAWRPQWQAARRLRPAMAGAGPPRRAASPPPAARQALRPRVRAAPRVPPRRELAASLHQVRTSPRWEPAAPRAPRLLVLARRRWDPETPRERAWPRAAQRPAAGMRARSLREPLVAPPAPGRPAPASRFAAADRARARAPGASRRGPARCHRSAIGRFRAR